MNKLRQLFCAFAFSEKKVFLLACITGVLLSVFSLIFTYDIYRDVAKVYAYYAREIGSGNFSEGWVGRVPMLQILLAGGISALGVNAYTANIFISCLFFVLTIFPLRAYLERYLTPLQAAWGCVLFITAPKVIRFSVSGLIDSSRYFFLILAFLFFFRLVEKRRWQDGLYLGLSLAGLSVSRGESVVFAPFFLLLVPVYAFLTQKTALLESLRKYTLITLFSAAVWFCGITPFCAANYHYNGIFITDVRLAEAFFPQCRTRPPRRVKEPVTPAYAADVLKNSLRGAYEIYLLAGILGIFLLFKSRRWRWDFSLMWIVFLLHFCIYFKINSAYRYSIYLVPVLMPFTITGFSWLIEKYRSLQFIRRFPACHIPLAAGAAVFLFLQMVNGTKCVTDRDDVWKRDIARIIKEWGEKNSPGKRLRLASAGLPEAVFWSGAYSVFSYKSGARDIRHFSDFDLLLLPEKMLPEIRERKDLEEVPLPEKGRYFLFRRIGHPKGKR